MVIIKVIMKTLILTILSILFINLTINIINTHTNIINTPKNFKLYIKNFENKYNVKVNTIFEFANLTETKEFKMIGKCNILFDIISIDKESWFQLNNIEKEWLIFHELGHCHFYLDHFDELDNKGCPKSIMHSFITEFYDKCKNYKFEKDLNEKRNFNKRYYR